MVASETDVDSARRPTPRGGQMLRRISLRHLAIAVAATWLAGASCAPGDGVPSGAMATIATGATTAEPIGAAREMPSAAEATASPIVRPAIAPSTAPASGATGPQLVTQAAAAQPVIAQTAMLARVVSIVDGDTIDVVVDGQTHRVRYIGIDTPETKDPRTGVQPYGPEATEANRRLVEGRDVKLVKDVSETDRYGRLLRYVYVDVPVGQIFVNLELVRQGFAVASTYPPDVAHQAEFVAAEREARNAKRGLWSAASDAPPTVTAATPPAPAVGPAGACDPSYPTVCIPPPPPDLDCGDIPHRRFQVVAPDPHRLDGDRDGIGCAS